MNPITKPMSSEKKKALYLDKLEAKIARAVQARKYVSPDSDGYFDRDDESEVIAEYEQLTYEIKTLRYALRLAKTTL